MRRDDAWLMTGAWLVVLIAAVVIYASLARWRGATWRSVAGVPTFAVSLALVEFSVPPVLARNPGTEVVGVAFVVAALLGSWLLWRALRPVESSSVAVRSS